MYRRVIILALLVVICFEAVAQNDSILVTNKDTVAYRYTPMTFTVPIKQTGWQRFVNYMVESELDRSFEKRVDMTFAPAIYYTPSTSIGLAVMAAGLYRIDKQNRDISPSNFSVYGAVSITGFYRVGVKGVNIFRNDNQRLSYNAEFFSQPSAFWGVGYDVAMANSSMRYLASRASVDVRFLQKIVKGLYVGAGVDYNYHFGKFGGEKYTSEEEFEARLNGDGVVYSAVGVSLFVEYDTRDVVSNPQRGVYVALQAKVRPKGLSNIDQTLWSGRLSANYYQKLWKGAILALDLQAEMNSEGTPWVYNASVGGASAMRGYYAGRFNDLCAITLQAELRQNIYKQFGAAAWGGAGNVFRNFGEFSWRKTLPTYGLGLRYEIKRNITLRLDYGFGSRDHLGKLIHGAVFSLNEAF